MGGAKKTLLTPAGLAVACAILLGVDVPTSLAQATDREVEAKSKIDLSPLPGVDASLFLVRKLETLLEQLPTTFDDGKAAAKRLAVIRTDLISTRTSVRTLGLDKSLDRMYEVALSGVDDLASLLIDLGAIDENYYKQQSDHSSRTVVEGASGGWQVGSAVAGLGSSR